MARKVIGFGAGGHAKVVIEILQCGDIYDLAGLLDPKLELRGTRVLGIPVLGDDDMLPGLMHEGIGHFFVGVGTVGDSALRQNLFEKAVGLGMEPVNAVHPHSIVSPSAKLGVGVTVMAGVVINACAQLGVNVIVNTGAVIEHDCTLGDHVHIATGARLCGGVQVASGAHVGAGTTVLQGMRIGENAIIGAGAVVIRDVQSGSTVAGCPAGPLDGKQTDE